VRRGARRVRSRRWGARAAQSGSMQMDMPKKKRTKTEELIEIAAVLYADREKALSPISRLS
jgi:hypothetical protein